MPRSTMRPSWSTQISSAFLMVERRWAMAIVVRVFMVDVAVQMAGVRWQGPCPPHQMNGLYPANTTVSSQSEVSVSRCSAQLLSPAAQAAFCPLTLLLACVDLTWPSKTPVPSSEPHLHGTADLWVSAVKGLRGKSTLFILFQESF